MKYLICLTYPYYEEDAQYKIIEFDGTLEELIEMKKNLYLDNIIEYDYDIEEHNHSTFSIEIDKTNKSSMMNAPESFLIVPLEEGVEEFLMKDVVDEYNNKSIPAIKKREEDEALESERQEYLRLKAKFEGKQGNG